MPINVEPNLDKPMPAVATPQATESLTQHARVMGNTALLLKELGDDDIPFEMTKEDEAQAASMVAKLKLDDGDQTKKATDKDVTNTKKEMSKPGVALALGSLVSYYDQQVIQDKVQLRNIAVNKFLELIESDDEKIQIKAAEMLGKAGDLFVEHSEVTVTHKSSDELKAAIRQRIEQLMQLEDKKAASPATRMASELDAIDVEAKEIKKDE